MSSSIISVENLAKRYVIGHQRESADGLRHTLNEAVRHPIQWLANRKREANAAQEAFWALKDVSFEVNAGEVVGIIGRNGAGKSTLLKILSRITEPTLGRIHLKGRVASLLEVGTGFHQDLTGRENIFLNGAILGMRRAEIKSKFDEIVAFSEVEQFLDTPVKRYSSGMYVRLAFAVAAHLEPEILIVDEVLAVGDVAFQKKCLGKMENVAKNEGRTVLFVSHNLGVISRLCKRAILLHGGRLAAMDSTEVVVSKYVLSAGEADSERTWAEHETAPGNKKIRLRGSRITDLEGRSMASVDVRRSFCIEIDCEVLEPMSHVRVALRLLAADGTVVFTSSDTSNREWRDRTRSIGRYVSRCEIPGSLLNEGIYVVTVGADIPFVEVLFFEENVITFKVEQTGGPSGQYAEKWPGVICPSLNWNIEFSDKSENSGEFVSSL